MRLAILTTALSLSVPLLALRAGDTPRPVPANEAAQRMTLPDGFRATLFVGEPDVVQPIAMTTDDRGRLWVAECYSYPKWQTSGAGRDRILIFDDRDGDGRFDRRNVYSDKIATIAGPQL